ncbi:MAG: hypothetical protein HOL08_04895, partial [Opitutae bacterium]|nr:hypothetical protein [Opitutae bacterium]
VDEADRPFEKDDTGDTIPSDLYFTNKDRTIHSSTGKLPYLTVGRQILISGTNDGDGDGVGDNDGVFTISKIIASKYAIEVDEELVDEGTIDEDGDGVPDGVSVSATVLGYDPILVPLSLGERAYSINGLASDHLITITAFLDANGNGGLDEFADPNGQYNSGNPVEVGKSGRFNLNLDLEQTSLAIDSVTTEEIDGGYYHTVIWNSVPAKQYRVLYSTSTPAGPYGTYVPAANGLPVVITGRDAPVVNPGDDPPKTSLVHFTVESPVWYRVEMVNAFGEGVPETDTDGDGLTDYHEGQLKLDPENPDVDEDGMPDGWEVLTGLTAYGNDLTLDGDTGKILSIAGLITESTTIGFDLASRKISFNNGMPAFIVGQQITVTGSKVNDGTYTISEVATDSTFIVVKESLNTETAGATVTVASFGGTDLSVFQDGAILVIKGTTAQLYDGVYKVIGASMTHEAQLSTVAGGLPSFQNGNGHPAEPGIWLTLYATDSDANPDGDGWEDVDASGNPIWHQYTNIEEYLGADHTLSIFRKELLPTRIFDGDWTHPNSVDTDMDDIDDGWERRYGLDPSSLNGTFGSDLSFKGSQVRSVESISISGENISFDAATRRINSLSSSFLAFSNSQWITITGSGFNDGVYEIESVSQFGEFITVTPAHTLIDEVKGADIYIRADREKTGTDISFNGNTIRASRTTASGSDIHFDDAGFIRSLANQNVQGTDLVFALNEVKSHFGLTTGFIVNDISFDAASQQISSLAGIFPDFVVGQQIFVNGSNSNDGFYTLAGIPVQGSILQVNEALIDEARQNVAGGGGPAPPKIIAVASVGGTDLSGFPGGFQVQIMGSTFNDGNFTLIAPSSQNLLQFATAMLNEPAGANTGISVLNSTNLSGFELGQQIIITGSTLNDGTYQVSNAVAPTAGAIAIQFDPLNPLQLQNEPPLVTRAPTVAAATNTNLSMFTRGGTLVVSGTAFNDGTYHINPFIDPTADTIQVQETFINEPMGPSTTILQTGATDLSGFLDNTTILVSGSFLNNGVYTIAKDGVSQHALTFAPSGIFAGFLREPAAADISISRDSDNDGLPDVLEFNYKTNPSEPDSDGDGGTDIAEVSGHFGGSDPTDSTSVLSSIVGTIIYETNENGIFYVSLTPVAEGINDLMFNSADRTISSASGRLPSLMAGDILEVTGTASNNGPFTVLEVVAPHTTLKVIESILDESPADTTVMGPPLLVSLPPNQRSFAITNLPSDVHVLLEAFLDSNGNAERDDFIDPSVTYNGGKPLLVGPGGRYNIVLDLSLTPLRIHPDEVDVKGVVTKEDEITGGYHHTITWKSVPGKIYQVRYSTATPAGPFSHYVTARTGLAEQVIGKAGGETTSLIHFSTHRDVFYRIEQLNADGTLTQEADSDGDGLTDYYEEALLLDPFTQDVDLDGMPDGWEVLTKITTHARDIRFNGSTITSVYSLTSANKSDISFAGNIISATSTEFPEFLAGHQLLITGSGKNDGTYILESVSDDRKTLTLSGTLEQEVAGATVTISSVGGTNLSIYPAGIILNVKGSTNTLNDGIFEVKVSSANQLNMVNATNGTDHVFILEDQDPEAPHYITLFASDADIDADIDGLSNLEEYLGADIEGSTFDPGLLAARVFDGDYTNATELDTDADTMDDGWERKYGLNPNALNGVSGTDLGFRGLQIKSISSIPVSGRDFTFNSATNRITALSTSLSSLQHARQ